MSYFEIILTGISLSLDAVAVSMVAGALKRLSFTDALKTASFFGGFQFFMPILGWALGYNFVIYLSRYGRLIGFVVLFCIGAKMLFEAFHKLNKKEIEKEKHITEIKTLTILAITTSIDALVVGITFNFVRVAVFSASLIIGLITFLLCVLGVLFGEKSKYIFGNKIEFLGSLILIALAFKILLGDL